MASKFEKAFAAARKAGKKEFAFNGKQYNTKLKEEDKASSPRPKANPNRSPADRMSGVSTPPQKPAATKATAQVTTKSVAKPAASTREVRARLEAEKKKNGKR